ncbi:MAG TPA: S41 family peptidase [Chitinophaga sp.]|uniref:S41 family peptidase n=1 Tax=Chitinophaga sp. TaxID=1869181 RepID=UPI002DB70507|nr:S41 family peptidase [Chitinophaga sp.]HEU4553682.1 S41 family peptidase [Chitinophaga sp.]
MKTKLLLLLSLPVILRTTVVCGQSKEVQFLIDTTISIMQQQSVNAKAVNWARLQKEALKASAGITDPYQSGPVIRELFRSIDDFHGRLFYKDSMFQWSHNAPVVSDSIKNEWKNRSGVKTYLVEKNIGYLRIPSMPYSGRKDCDFKAQSLNDSLCLLLTQNIKGLIIDLRINGGGAMYPMILGVEQLLMHGRIGSFEPGENAVWYLTDDDFAFDTTVLASITPKCSINAQHMPVVILTSPATGSSAEFFIIAFKGRPETVLLGSPTAGFITSIKEFVINDAASVLLSTSYGVDRNGKVYKAAIKPDIPFADKDSFNDIPNDEKVGAAVKWLKQHMNN